MSDIREPGSDPARWLPLLVALVGLLLSALLAAALVQGERRHRDQIIAVETSAIVAALRAGLNQRASVLARTARRWQLAGGRARAEFDLEAAANIESYPGIRAMGWVDPNHVVRWVHPSNGNEAAIGLDNARDPNRRAALLAARAQQGLAVAGPIDLAQGGRGLLLFHHVGPVEGELQGFIFAAVDPQVTHRQILDGLAPQYSLRVSVNREAIYQRAASGERAEVGARPTSIARFVFGGVPWQVEIWSPSPRLGLVQTLPAIAALLSLALAAATRAALRSQARALSLRRAVRTGEERFRAVFENAAVGVARVGFEDARFLEVNDALCLMLGYSREEMASTPWTEITHPEDIELDLMPFRRMAAGEIDTYAVEKRFHHKAGHDIWARLTLSLVRDPAGRPDFEICIVEDVTERRRVEAVVRESEDRVRRVLDQLFAFVGITELDGTLVEANRAPLEAAGIAPEDVLGKPFWEAYWWAYDETVQARLKNAVARAAAGEVVRYDVPIRIAGGKFATIDFQISPLRDAKGAITHLVPSAVPVEERVRAQADLAEREERLRYTVELSPIVPWTADPDGQITGFSDRLMEWTGRSREDLLGPGWMEVLHPEDRRRMVEAWTRSLSTGEPYELEHRIRFAEGSYRRMHTRAYARIVEGRIVQWYGTFEDVHARETAKAGLLESEGRYRTLIESIEAGFSLVELRFDEAGRPVDYAFIEVNPAFERQTGVVNAVGKTVRQLLPGLEAHWFEIYGRVALTGEPARFENGSEVMDRWYDVYAVAVGDGPPHRVGILFNDISERRRAEEEVRRLNRDLEQRVAERTERLAEVNAELQSFAYSVSHDLRAPLRAMQGFSHALVEDYGDRLDDLGRDYIGRISAGAKQMDALIQDLLAYSRLSREEITPTPVLLEAVVDAALRQLGAALQDLGAVVRVERALPVVMGHAPVLTQIIANLLSNASKFVSSGTKPLVRVWAEQRGQNVRLWVEDNGIGIAPEHQSRIFDVFQRLHGMIEYPGTGIGLAIVRKGAERLGGAVGVESELGEGSRFWIELPQER